MARLTYDKLKAMYRETSSPHIAHHKRDEEHQLQVACCRWFRTAYPHLSLRLNAVPNGGRRDAVTGAKLKAEGVLAGVADLELHIPNATHHGLFIEMKTPKGRLSEAQCRWRDAVTERGEYQYTVCRSLDEFRKTVQDYIPKGY